MRTLSCKHEHSPAARPEGAQALRAVIGYLTADVPQAFAAPSRSPIASPERRDATRVDARSGDLYWCVRRRAELCGRVLRARARAARTSAVENEAIQV
jgi:hypothetical protein